MPCGPIYPIEPVKDGDIFTQWCFHCGKGASPQVPLDHYCDEWDCYLHGGCVVPFIATDSGSIVLAHGHYVQLYDTIVSPGYNLK